MSGAVQAACAMVNSGTPFSRRKAFFSSNDTDGFASMNLHAAGTESTCHHERRERFVYQTKYQKAHLSSPSSASFGEGRRRSRLGGRLLLHLDPVRALPKAPLRSAMTAGVARAGAVGARPGAVKAMAAAAMA